MSTFPVHTRESAPPESRNSMTAVASKFGFMPAAVAQLASSPEALHAFLGASGQYERASLDPISREVVVMTIATRYECHVCVALHSAALDRHGAPGDLVEALRECAPLGDPRLEALRAFALATMDGHGIVDDETFDAFRAAGYDERNALEVVLAIGAYTLSAFANRMTDAALDDAFAAYAWTS